jgi:hypothetical protein
MVFIIVIAAVGLALCVLVGVALLIVLGKGGRGS